MDGIEACQQIRALPRYAAVPIVLLTVFDVEGMKRRALRAGASAFLSKPFSRGALLAALGPLIAGYRRRMELERY
jgi:CheY-like chemotaxis protein